jgi:hypothetical protein
VVVSGQRLDGQLLPVARLLLGFPLAAPPLRRRRYRRSAPRRAACPSQHSCGFTVAH